MIETVTIPIDAVLMVVGLLLFLLGLAAGFIPKAWDRALTGMVLFFLLVMGFVLFAMGLVSAVAVGLGHPL